MQVSALQTRSASQIATSAHAGHRERLGPSGAQALTEGRKAASTEAATTPLMSALLLEAWSSHDDPADDGRRTQRHSDRPWIMTPAWLGEVLGAGAAERVCICKRSILRTSSRALVSASSGLPAGRWDGSSRASTISISHYVEPIITLF
jgi:hypothetical protein